MIKKLLRLFSLLMLSGSLAYAQQHCGFDKKHNNLLLNDLRYQSQVEKMEEEWLNYVSGNNPKKMVITGSDTIYEIPIVVHVIHTGSSEGTEYNRSDSDIMDWVEFTNKIFEGTAPGYAGEGAGGTKIPVRLVLAQRDEACGPTTGIVRVDGSVLPGYAANGVFSGTTGVHETDIFNLSRWNSKYYYNIYIVNKIDGEDGYSSTSSYTAGYAYFPPAPSGIDGSVMLSYIVEENESTFAHEFGHAMGLYHTFQDADDLVSCSPIETPGNCASVGDRVCDTESSKALLGEWPCPTNTMINPCTSELYEGVQYNIMNYSYCPNRFTPGQSERAIYMLTTYRASLINSNATLPPDPSGSYGVSSACAPSGILVPINFFGSGPTSVVLGDLNVSSNQYSSSISNFYEDFTNVSDLCLNSAYSTELVKGSVYTMSVTLSTNPQFMKVYIDFNGDGYFDEWGNEVVYNSLGFVGANTFTFNIPETAVSDSMVRMRIRTDLITTGGIPLDACAMLFYGQTEDYAVKITSVPLSHSNKKFSSSESECSAILSWTVKDDKVKIETIELEKSADGRNYETIENFFVNQYEDSRKYTDANMLNGEYFYRLKITNAINRISYTHVEKVTIDCHHSFVAFPNPSDGRFGIRFFVSMPERYTLKVYNVLGVNVYQEEFESQEGLNERAIDLSSAADGLYYLTLSSQKSEFKRTITIRK